MQKAHSNINWENYPSEETPINEKNLNKMDAAIDVIDDRVIALDSTKLDKTTAQTMVKNVEFDEGTGIFTITYLNGSTIILDTKLEKLAVNFSFDKENQKLIIVLDDGTKQEVDLSTLITEYEFSDTDAIAFSVDSTGKVSAIVKDGSITEDKLQPNFLADVKVEVAKAQASATSASTSATDASNSAKEAESYAHGGTGTRDGEDADNAKYYYQQTKQVSQSLNGIIPQGTVAFADLPTSGMEYGDMYNISDAFTSDERFNDGGGIVYGPGNNVIWISGDKWDVLAGSSVTGVKGNKETTYRQGNVNITPEDIGALPEDGNAVSATKATQDSNGNIIVDTYRTKTGDTNTNIVTFSSGDSTNPTGWEDINVVESGETHGSLFRKISLAIKNLRYLYNMIGTADIAAIGDGTIKGAITGLNSNKINRGTYDESKFTNASSLAFGHNNTTYQFGFEMVFPDETRSNIYYNATTIGQSYFNGSTWEINDIFNKADFKNNIYSPTLSKVVLNAGNYYKNSMQYYFNFNIKATADIPAYEIFMILPEKTNNQWTYLLGVSNGSIKQIVCKDNELYCESPISNGEYLTIIGVVPIRTQ